MGIFPKGGSENENFQAMFASNMIEFVQKESVRIIDITQVTKTVTMNDENGDDDGQNVIMRVERI